MEQQEARAHLEMVDRILATARTTKNAQPSGHLMIAFGFAAATINVGLQFMLDGRGPALLDAGTALMVLAWIYSSWKIYQSRRAAVRMSTSEARMGKVIAAVWICVFVASFSQPHVFANWGASAIWTLGAAIQMLVIGFFGDRRAAYSSAVLLASLVAANSFAGLSGYMLAAGFLFGYLLPGIVYLSSGEGCESCG